MGVVLVVGILFTIFCLGVVAYGVWRDRVDAQKAVEEADAAAEQKRWDDPMKPAGIVCPKGKYAKRVMSGGWACCDIGSICD